MKFKDIFKKDFYRAFGSRFRISMRDPHTDEEVWRVFISPLNFIIGVFAFILVLFIAVVTLVAFTPIMDLLPGYQGNRARNILIESNMKLDSLERELTIWDNYYRNIALIMDGMTPIPVEGYVSDTTYYKATNVPRIEADSMLRLQMEGPGEYSLQRTAPASGTLYYREMYPPIKGVVTKKFDPAGGMLGVDILSADNMPVASTLEGTVLSATWTPTEGSVMYIIHPGNMMSGYLYNSRLLKKAGDTVEAGEVVAFTGSSLGGDADRGYVQFQLWYNGTPVNPENYIVF